MKSPRHETKPPAGGQTEVPFTSRWQRITQRLDAFQLRTVWWRTLDRWEGSKSFRWASIGMITAVLGAAALLFWGYPWWTKRNSVKMARQWLAAGRINYAVEAVQQAMQLDPQNPEPWQIAAEIARRRGQKTAAADYAHHAVTLAPGNSALLIAWAAEALRADLTAESAQALDQVATNELEKSSDAHRLLGELARREGRFADAKRYFETAVQIDGPVAIDEVPLGLILLSAKDPAQYQRGRDLLIKWTADREWDMIALRALLTDARVRNDRTAQLKWVSVLRASPGFTNGDMPTYLAVLTQSDPARFSEVLASMEKDHAVSPDAATRLLGWLNQIGRSDEAVRWMKTLPADAMQLPPLVVAGAEALRQVADWPALQTWTQAATWGTDGEFLRWAYRMQAARKLGNETEAKELWLTLYSHAQLNGVHALFAGSTLFSWGLETDAEALWWRAAEQEGPTAIDALGSLARYYQTHQDAEGQYRVFRRLHFLHPHDAATGNNFSFFAALTGRDQRLAEQVARENLASAPQNQIYIATLAFNLYMQDKAAESLALLKPFAAKASQSPVLSFAYGLALAGTGKKTEAHQLLDGMAAHASTKREAEIIQMALNR